MSTAVLVVVAIAILLAHAIVVAALLAVVGQGGRLIAEIALVHRSLDELGVRVAQLTTGLRQPLTVVIEPMTPAAAKGHAATIPDGPSRSTH